MLFGVYIIGFPRSTVVWRGFLNPIMWRMLFPFC